MILIDYMLSQVIAAAGKPFPGQIAPHMLTATAGKAGVLQAGGQGNWFGSFCLRIDNVFKFRRKGNLGCLYERLHYKHYNIIPIGYSPAAIPTTGNQTLVISQLPVGVISSQQHNILPAHSSAHKATDMQKVSEILNLR